MPSAIRLRKLAPFLFLLLSLVAATAASASPAAASASPGAPASAGARASAGAGASSVQAGIPAPSQWPQFGQSAQHLNTNPDEHTFTVANVARLRTAFTAHFGDNTVTEGG